MKKEKKVRDNEKYWVMFLSILFIGIFYMITAPIESSASFECKADYIGLDLETKTIVQNYTSEYSSHNLTSFVEDTLKDKFNIKDLNGLSCKGEIKLKAPYILIQNNLLN